MKKSEKIRNKAMFGIVVGVMMAFSAYADEHTDLTKPQSEGGVITYCNSLSPYTGDKAFDNGTVTDGASRWLAYHRALPNAWVQYYFADGAVPVNAYRVWGLTSASFATRAPKAFKLEGSNTGADDDWTLLDTQENQTGWTDAEARYFEFANVTAYSYYRFTITANNGATDYTGVGELEFFTTDAIFLPSVETGCATEVVVASARLNSGLISTGVTATTTLVYWGDSDGGTVATDWDNEHAWAAPQEPGDFSYDATGLATNTMYFFRYAASNAAGVAWAPATCTFVTDEVRLETVSDADEETVAPAVVRVSRGAAHTGAELVVFLEQSGGTAVEGVDFEALPDSVTIPAGEASADIQITPIRNLSVNADTTIVLSVQPINCLGSTPTTVTIQNISPPAGCNTWIGSGNASDAANWSQGVPTADDAVLLSIFSNGDMVWDAGVNGLPGTVASWTQTADYTGTVSFNTTYPDYDTVFTNFTVTGNVAIEGGAWTHPANSDKEAWRLRVTVGGDFLLGSAARVDVQGRGYAAGKYPSGGAASVHGGAVDRFSAVYGDVYQPTRIGAGAVYGSQSGGGAVWLDIAGDATVDGAINAKAQDGGKEASVGAGGSIYMVAKSISGSGTLSASGNGYYGQSAGSGGRIALVLTEAPEFGLSAANITARGALGSTSAGAGTIVMKTATQSYGQLIVDNYTSARTHGKQPPTKYGTTCIPAGETWTFDSVRFRNQGILSIPEGTTLALPNGLLSVSSSNTSGQSGILYMGGVLDIPEHDTGTYTFMSNWVFQADSPYTFDGDVVVENGGAIGCMTPIRNSMTTYAQMQLTVTGNMNVKAGGKIIANMAGLDWNGNTSNPKYSGNGTIGFHGGQSGSHASNMAYGSVLNPAMPGVQGQNGDFATTRGGGGVLILAVGGNLNVDGTVSSTTSSSAYAWSGAGGSINLTAATLTGSGTINANGVGSTSSTGYASGGGRVAIRLTGNNAGFDDFGESKITARGVTASGVYSSSAGTIYLQTAEQGEARGRVLVRNGNNAANTALTWFPSVTKGGENDDLKNVALELGGCARVKLSQDALRINTLHIADNSTLDLNGSTLTVTSMKAGGVNIPAGVYGAGSALFEDGYALDSSGTGEGQIVVNGDATIIIVR